MESFIDMIKGVKPMICDYGITPFLFYTPMGQAAMHNPQAFFLPCFSRYKLLFWLHNL